MYSPSWKLEYALGVYLCIIRQKNTGFQNKISGSFILNRKKQKQTCQTLSVFTNESIKHYISGLGLFYTVADFPKDDQSVNSFECHPYLVLMEFTLGDIKHVKCTCFCQPISIQHFNLTFIDILYYEPGAVLGTF
jgi:hypothetical protein